MLVQRGMDPFTNCARKDRYPDKASAARALAAMYARGGVVGRPVAYRCKVAGTGRHWHIGRVNGRRGSR
jgi:hypothetical protein